MGVNVKYLAYVKERFWRKGGVSPDTMSDGDVSITWEGTDNQPGEGACLVGFSGARAARNTRNYPADQRDEMYARNLERLLPGFRDSFVKSRYMDWPGDEFTMAGYSFPRPGQIGIVGPILRKGIDNLHFAGEHCSSAFVGYMEGALSSGVTAARSIAKRDGLIMRV
jgi:monoamine oxidase